METHLKRMYDIYLKLMSVYDYWMVDSCAIETVLMSLPPNYEKHARGNAIKRDTMNFFVFVSQFKSVKVEPIEGEIFDATCIFDIQSYKCILLMILDGKYLILILFMKQVLITTSMRRYMM